MSDQPVTTGDLDDTVEVPRYQLAHLRHCEAALRTLAVQHGNQAQKIHQAHHENGTWRECPKDICASARAELGSLERLLAPGAGIAHEVVRS